MPTPELFVHPNERWSVRVLGGVSVERAGFVCERFPTRRAALILIRLAFAQGRAVNRDALAADLWPDEFADATKPRLRQELARLRRALGSAEAVLETDRLTLRLDPALADIDLKEAEALLLRAALERDREADRDLIDRLADLPGEVAPGYEEPWIAAVREEWRSRTSQILMDVAEAHAKRDDPDSAIRLARKAAATNLFGETIQSRFLQLLSSLGRHEEASAHLAELDKSYRQLLGTGPTQRLSQWIEAPKARPYTPRVTLERARGLPAPLTELFGRKFELDRLATLLQPSGSARLATLSGPGGIGKTQLGLAAGRALQDEYDHRVWFVALSDVQSPSRIGKQILDVLGLVAIDEDPIDVAAAALAGAPALMILDNFEQLVDGGAQFVRRLLEQCDQLKLIVTTRRKLNIEGEHELSVSPLPLPAAVDLFVSLARRARPDFEYGDENLQLVADIVRLLDRMPLAIHLAASRAAVLSLPDMRAQLARRFDLLVSRRSDLEPRHRTLRQAVAWSYDQLDPRLQKFFVDLSIFRGGWTAALASEVLEEPDALNLLEELRDNSLIAEDPGPDEMRFTMLLTLREFAQERQEPKRATAQGRRLSRSLLKLIEEANSQLLGVQQFAWYERLQREHDNIRWALHLAALEDPEMGLTLCGKLWRFWSVRGHQVEARGWFRRFLPPDLPLSLTGSMALFGAARCAAEQGDTRAALKWYERARAAEIQLGREAWVATIEMNMADIFLQREDYAEATRLAEAHLEAFVSHGDTYLEGIARDCLGSTLTGQGRLEQAGIELEKARSLLELHTDQIAIAYCMVNLGNQRLAAGEPGEASALLLAALDVHRRFGNQHGMGWANECLARAALEEGRLGDADHFLTESSASRTAIGDWLGIAHIHRLRAELEARRGRKRAVEDHLREANRLFRACGCERLTDACSPSASTC